MEQPAEMDRRRPSGPGDALLFVFSRFHSFFLSAFSLFAFFCFFDVDVHGRVPLIVNGAYTGTSFVPPLEGGA